MIYSYILPYKHTVQSINPTNVGGITKLLTQHMRIIPILSSVDFVQYLLLYTVQITREHTYVSAVHHYNYIILITLKIGNLKKKNRDHKK